MFVSLDKFPMPAMEVSLSALSNFNEQCAIISGAITYQNLNGFGLEAIIYGYIGPKNTEYYFNDYTGLVQVLAKIVF